MATLSEQKPSSGTAFEMDAEPVLRSLRDALHSLVMPGLDRRVRASDLPRSLGIAQSLAWQVFRVATAEDPFSEVALIPRPDAMAKVLTAAGQAGYAEPAIQAAATSYQAFEQLVARHANSRASFDAMAAGLGRGASERTDMPARRAAFRANSQLWGFQAGLCYKCMVVAPGAQWRTNPLVILRGVRSLRALRKVRSIPLGKREFASVGHGVEFGRAVSEQPGAVLLEDFCSAGLPAIETNQAGETGHDFLNLPEIGLTGKVDVFMASTTRCVNLASREIGTATVMHMPCEEFVTDLIVPAGLWDLGTLDAGVYACIEDVSRARTLHPDFRLPHAHQAEYLGRSLDALYDGSFPRCPEMIRHVLRTHRWTHAEYDVCRFRIRYPMLHSCVSLEVLERSDAAGPSDGPAGDAAAPR